MISWPAGIKARGEVRHQYHHAVDIVPTILECCGVEFPDYVLGYEQTPCRGCRCATASTTPAPRRPRRCSTTRCSAPAGSGAGAGRWWPNAAPQVGLGNYENDTWQLFHTDEDRAEAHDLAAQHPDKVRELVDLWYAEAGKYDVLPLDDRSIPGSWPPSPRP